MFLLTGWAITALLIVNLGNFLGNPDNISSLKVSANIASPTPTISPTSTPTPSPTPTPTSTPTPTKPPVKLEPSATPKPEITNPPSGDTALNLLKEINDFRAGNGLPAFSTDGYTCGFATLRAGEIAGNFSHEGFNQRISSNSLPYPSYSGVSENIANYTNVADVVPSWINSPTHNENLRRDHPYACVAKSGNYYVFLTWKP